MTKSNKYGKLLLVAVLLSIIFSCSDNKEGTLYAPFQIGKDRKWMSIEEAEQANKVNGIIEVSKFVGMQQTEQQKKAADDLYAETLANAKEKGWFYVKNGLADGYLFEPEATKLHFPNYDYLYDNDRLNPQAPEYLMYYPTKEGMLLAGVMFYLDDTEAQGVQIGGPETIWHYHDYPPLGRCLKFTQPLEGGLGTLVRRAVSRFCPEGYWFRKTPEMLHLWFIDHPAGRFGTRMGIDVRLLLSSELVISEHQKAKTKAEGPLRH